MEFIKPSVQAYILQNYQEAEFLNQNYRQKYCKILKRWIYKPGLQAKILQNSEETRVFPYKKHSQKYEPTMNEPKKDWKNTRLSGGH